jgi:hypothetical protein
MKNFLRENKMDKPWMDTIWRNIGDVNPREHGGIFVRIKDDCVEVVQTNDLAEGEKPPKYMISDKTESITDLESLWEIFCHYPKKPGVALYADWRILADMDEIQRLYRMAADLLSYNGGDCEEEFVSNYWESLRSYGIYPRHS